MFAPGSFDGAKILVTGGGTGLGRMMAGRLLSLGAHVVIAGRRAGVLEETAAALTAEHGGRVDAHAADIRDPEAVEALLDACFEGGPPTGLVNNAGANFISRTEDLSVRAFDAVAGIVMRGTYMVTHAAGRRWIEAQAPGAVVSILTTRLRTGAPFSTPSTMAKAAVESMTRSLALEWGRHGIRLNAIAPGEIPTEGMSARLRPGEVPGAATAAVNPLGRAGGPEDIGALAAFLLSPASGWITGETIFMDGGQHRAAGVSSYALRERSDEDWARIRDAVKARNDRDREGR